MKTRYFVFTHLHKSYWIVKGGKNYIACEGEKPGFFGNELRGEWEDYVKKGLVREIKEEEVVLLF
jgi:hypothetical protein